MQCFFLGVVLSGCQAEKKIWVEGVFLPIFVRDGREDGFPSPPLTWRPSD
jgi:hypothetical protein